MCIFFLSSKFHIYRHRYFYFCFVWCSRQITKCLHICFVFVCMSARVRALVFVCVFILRPPRPKQNVRFLFSFITFDFYSVGQVAFVFYSLRPSPHQRHKSFPYVLRLYRQRYIILLSLYRCYYYYYLLLLLVH